MANVKNWIVDRIVDGSMAVIELSDGKTIDVSVENLPGGVREGDVLSVGVDQDETRRRRDRIEKLMGDLWAED